MIMAKATRGRIHGGLPLRGDGSPLHVHARAEEIFYDYLLLSDYVCYILCRWFISALSIIYSAELVLLYRLNIAS